MQPESHTKRRIIPGKCFCSPGALDFQSKTAVSLALPNSQQRFPTQKTNASQTPCCRRSDSARVGSGPRPRCKAGTPQHPPPHRPQDHRQLPRALAWGTSSRRLCCLQPRRAARERYLHRDLRESWSRKLWSFFTAPMSRGNNESGEESERKISGGFQASRSIRHKGQR